MKNINNCAKLGFISFSYKDYGLGLEIDDGNGYVGCLEIESREELNRLINLLKKLEAKGNDTKRKN